jgi:hypothetical protein
MAPFMKVSFCITNETAEERKFGRQQGRCMRECGVKTYLTVWESGRVKVNPMRDTSKLARNMVEVY